MKNVYIVDAVLTPVGRYNGGLSSVRPDDLGAHAIRELLGRTPDLDPARIEDVYFGNANGAGEENRNVGRMAALLAGLLTSVPGVTVNRLCASGLEAVIQAARAIALGDASIAVAGGVGSMTRAPYVLPKSDKPFPAAHTDLYSTTLGWCMVNPRMEPQWTIPLGESAELIAEKHKITREQQDEFALASHRKAAEAQEAGLFDAELAPVPVPQRKCEPVLFGADECVRADASLEAMAKLKAVVPQGRRHGHPRQRLTSQRWGRRPAARRRRRPCRDRSRAAGPDLRDRGQRPRPALLRARPRGGRQPGTRQGGQGI